MDTPQTPPTNYVPAKWTTQYSKIQLQWLVEQLRNRQEASRQDAREARNESTLLASRIAVLETSIQLQKERIR